MDVQAVKPWLDDGDVKLYHGHVVDVLRSMPAASVDCIITSPPYYGLRDYGTGRWEGGDEACDHPPVGSPDRDHSGSHRNGSRGEQGHAGSRAAPQRAVCGKCGARRRDDQIGLEASPAEYLDTLVGVFREARRVLADHGTCWVNMGDSYGQNQGKGFDTNQDGGARKTVAASPRVPTGVPAKNLLGMPWRLALALQDDAWILRRDIIWSKPNPMPESTRDRCTSAHEYVFMLTKRPRYYYDADAVREAGQPREYREHLKPRAPVGDERTVMGSRWNEAPGPTGFGVSAAGRNARSVWEIATQPTPEAHFATYPEELVRRCLLAGCKPGGVVLDPFIGSGTTARVARNHGRHAIGIDLNEEYLRIAAKRLGQQSLLTQGAAS